MADAASHLEKMGRELKCPICLSLVETAASLTCNHVFCKVCIHKSLKSGPNCPVCKVPFQRREIRPAPHMDNLVNIYKNMEVASGFSIFVSQNQPKANLSEGKSEGDLDLRSKKAGIETLEAVDNETSKEIGSEASSKSKPRNFGRNRRKPSFASNKRVQVPQSPITETPVRQAPDGLGKNKLTNNAASKNQASPSALPSSNAEQIPLLSPFFWLREEDEDAEKSSQRTNEEKLTGSPAKAPSFSDIKDSDNEAPSNTPSSEWKFQRCKKIDLSDSEMFEWTQRECSPELCLTPNQKQVEPTCYQGGQMEKNLEAPSSYTNGDRDVRTGCINMVNSQRIVKIKENEFGTSPDNKTKESNKRNKMPQKRGRKSSKRNCTKRQKKNKLQSEDLTDGSGTSSNLCQREELERAAESSKAADPTSEEGKLMNKVEQYTSELSALPGNKRSTRECKDMRDSKKLKRIKEIQGHSHVIVKKPEQNLVNGDKPDEITVSTVGKLAGGTFKPKLSDRKIVDKASNIALGSTFRPCKTKEDAKQLRSEYGKQVPASNILREKFSVGKGNVQLEAENDHVTMNFDTDKLRVPLEIAKENPKIDMPTLRKCGSKSFQCAFCHTTEEASGVIVHYCEGRPVSSDHSRGSVIHSHKNCTEWAPNVYFDDDIAVNLEAELTRSRRIKCSLCGAKGASLGCFEKSCRKSFHVPCAKKLKECRWDNDHFVILCPLHASSKLPGELPDLKVKKAKCGLKRRKLPCQQSPSATARDASKITSMHVQSSDKVILCCSGVGTAEKEIVSDFAKSSGIVVSSSWNLNVTHVIVSVDENGACRRTLKVLMAILEGKWILSVKWIEACINAGKLVEEAPYEISCDIHGVENGPRLGRLRVVNKEPKIFSGFKFYLAGDYNPSYKGYLIDLITAAGGTMLHRKPIAETLNIDSSKSTVIVYSIELPENCHVNKTNTILDLRRSEAEALASSSGSKAVTNSWIVNCIAGHKLQDV